MNIYRKKIIKPFPFFRVLSKIEHLQNRLDCVLLETSYSSSFVDNLEWRIEKLESEVRRRLFN